MKTPRSIDWRRLAVLLVWLAVLAIIILNHTLTDSGAANLAN